MKDRGHGQSTNPPVLVRVLGESERGIASSDGGKMVTESGSVMGDARTGRSDSRLSPNA